MEAGRSVVVTRRRHPPPLIPGWTDAAPSHACMCVCVGIRVWTGGWEQGRQNGRGSRGLGQLDFMGVKTQCKIRHLKGAL